LKHNFTNNTVGINDIHLLTGSIFAYFSQFVWKYSCSSIYYLLRATRHECQEKNALSQAQ